MGTTNKEESRLRARAADLERRIAGFEENAGSSSWVSHGLTREILDMFVETLRATRARLPQNKDVPHGTGQ
jgi:hypothetical protein